MIEYLYWLAVLCGIVAALTGSRAAWALLASAALCWGLDASGWQFEAGVWLAIDIAVIAAILVLRSRATDWIVLALFVPIFALYAADEYTRYYGVTILIMLQFIVTLPWKAIGLRAARTIPHSTADDIFHFRVQRGRVWSDRKA